MLTASVSRAAKWRWAAILFITSSFFDDYVIVVHDTA
jgi:hypothetical protein